MAALWSATNSTDAGSNVGWSLNGGAAGTGALWSVSTGGVDNGDNTGWSFSSVNDRRVSGAFRAVVVVTSSAGAAAYRSSAARSSATAAATTFRNRIFSGVAPAMTAVQGRRSRDRPSGGLSLTLVDAGAVYARARATPSACHVSVYSLSDYVRDRFSSSGISGFFKTDAEHSRDLFFSSSSVTASIATADFGKHRISSPAAASFFNSSSAYARDLVSSPALSAFCKTSPECRRDRISSSSFSVFSKGYADYSRHLIFSSEALVASRATAAGGRVLARSSRAPGLSRASSGYCHGLFVSPALRSSSVARGSGARDVVFSSLSFSFFVAKAKSRSFVVLPTDFVNLKTQLVVRNEFLCSGLAEEFIEARTYLENYFFVDAS